MQQVLTDGFGYVGGGDTLAGTTPVNVNTGLVWYVNSAIGANDAVHGFDMPRPLASLAYLVNTVGLTAGDVVVLAPAHAETISANTTIAVNDVTIVGVGGTPTTTPRLTVASGFSLILTAASGTTFRNVVFPASVVGNRTVARILANTATVVPHEFIGCEFVSGTHDVHNVANPEFAAAIYHGSVGATVGLRLVNTSFASSSTTLATIPGPALYSFAGRYTNIVMDGVDFDGGPYGWYRYAADLAEGNGRTVVKGVGVALIRGSDVLLGSTAPGYVQVYGPSGGGRVIWGAR